VDLTPLKLEKQQEINNINIGLCQVVKKEKVIKWLRISVKKD
jgi:hypothetical protein